VQKNDEVFGFVEKIIFEVHFSAVRGSVLLKKRKLVDLVSERVICEIYGSFE